MITLIYLPQDLIICTEAVVSKLTILIACCLPFSCIQNTTKEANQNNENQGNDSGLSNPDTADESSPEGETTDECEDGIDNDNDGLIDCDDQDCTGTLYCDSSAAITPENCQTSISADAPDFYQRYFKLISKTMRQYNLNDLAVKEKCKNLLRILGSENEAIKNQTGPLL